MGARPGPGGPDDPDRSRNAGDRLGEAENAAGEIPARLIEVAMVTLRTDPVRAEQIARTIKSGAEIIYTEPGGSQYEGSATTGYMRSAEYWRARALADLVIVSHERKRKQDSGIDGTGGTVDLNRKVRRSSSSDPFSSHNPVD